MKPTRIVSMLMLISTFTFSAWSQREVEFGGKLRQRFTQIKLAEIRRELNIPPERMIQFRPIYMRYEMEKANTKVRFEKGLMRVNPDSLSDAEVEKFVKTQLANAKRLIEVREMYYDEFRKVLSPREIIRLYQCENNIQKRINQEIKRRAQRFRTNNE